MEQQDRIMDGDLQTLGLQSILKMLALSGKTGKLFVSSGPETLSISLRKGQIVGLHEEGVAQPDLLGMLCLINKLDPPRAQSIRERYAVSAILRLWDDLFAHIGVCTADAQQPVKHRVRNHQRQAL